MLSERAWLFNTVMSVTYAKRLRKEMYNLQSAPPDNDIALVPDEEDIRHWRAHIRGPPDTPFAGGERSANAAATLYF